MSGRSEGISGPAVTVILGGLVVGILDMLDAFFYFGWMRGAGVQRTFQGVAAGVLGGEAARSGGWPTFWLGLGLHFINALIISAIFYLITSRVARLRENALLWSLAFGVMVHFVMQYAVIPASAIGQYPKFDTGVLINGIIGHALAVGLPLGVIFRYGRVRNGSE